MPGAEGFFLEGKDHGVMLIHGGGGGTTADMRELGKYIFEKTGYSVFAPLLPGYGTTKEELAATQVDDWLNAVREGFLQFKAEVQKIFVVGHSMGAGLALYLASEFPQELNGVVSICAPTKLKGLLVKLVPFFKLFLKYRKQNDLEELKRISNGVWVGYEDIPLNIVAKFKKLMHIMKSRLPQIIAPILIIQAEQDEFVPTYSSSQIYESVSSTDKSIKSFDSDHAIIFAKIKTDLFACVVDFIKKL